MIKVRGIGYSMMSRKYLYLLNGRKFFCQKYLSQGDVNFYWQLHILHLFSKVKKLKIRQATCLWKLWGLINARVFIY